MKKVVRNILIIMIMTFLVVIAPDSPVSAEELGNTISMQDVKTSLSENEQSLKEFEALPLENQELFVAALNDPVIFEENLTITLEEEYNDVPDLYSSYSIASTSTIKTHSGNRTYSIGLAGLKLTNYVHYLKYQSRNNKAIKILENTARVSSNYNPLVKTSLQSKAAYINADSAYANAYFTYSIGPLEGVSVPLGVLKHTMKMDGKGSVRISNWVQL